MAGGIAVVTEAPETLRAFIALPLPPDWRGALAQAMAEMRVLMPSGVRWVEASGIHLTLKFLGATDASMAPGIMEALGRQLRGAGRPRLVLSGLGTFPGGKEPRVIWAGVGGETGVLGDWQQRVEAAAGGLGWPRERRPFRPHLTLGRVRDGTAAAQRRAMAGVIGEARLPAAAEWEADTVGLYHSALTPRGAIYTSLGEVRI